MTGKEMQRAHFNVRSDNESPGSEACSFLGLKLVSPVTLRQCRYLFQVTVASLFVANQVTPEHSVLTAWALPLHWYEVVGLVLQECFSQACDMCPHVTIGMEALQGIIISLDFLAADSAPLLGEVPLRAQQGFHVPSC